MVVSDEARSCRSCRSGTTDVCCSREWAAMVELVCLLAPIVAANFLNVLVDRWSLVLVGHWDFQDRSHYDGTAIGKMYSNITGLSLGVGATIGLATFCSQAHGSGRSQVMNPIFMRRAMLLLSAAYLFSVSCALLCEPLLLLCKQPAAVARTSARFAQVQVLGLPFFWFQTASFIGLNSVKQTRPGLITSMATASAQVLASVAFTHPKLLNCGYIGVALGRVVSGVVSATTMVSCVKCMGLEAFVWRRHPEAEPVLRPGAFADYLKVSIPSALVVWSEWWAFEVLSLLAGWTPDAELNLAAHGTMFNVIGVFYMCWVGTCTAVCTLVGNLLGAGRNADILPVLRAASAFSITTSLVVAGGYELCKGWLAMLFTEDQSVRSLLSSSSLGLVLSVPLYAQLMTFYGALRGANFQKQGILGTFVGYWIVGIPLGAVLGCILHWPTPLVGIWLGNAAALGIAAAWVTWAVFVQIDWLTVSRLEDSEAPLISSQSAQGPAPSTARTCAEEAEQAGVPVPEGA